MGFTMKAKELIKFLEARGFWHERDGRHKVMSDGTHIVPIPEHTGDLKKGTLGNALRLAGLKISDAKEWKERG
ncbi:MAG: type II toxin-antitoxin system HicA family toxin [Synergistaceae bacterium]|nr:type II toxin-antitoxin system HicA family toxin [Synergistaceae bacterium]